MVYTRTDMLSQYHSFKGKAKTKVLGDGIIIVVVMYVANNLCFLSIQPFIISFFKKK